MNKLMFAAMVVASTAVVAFGHEDVSAKTEGYYDVTLTTKRLAHVEKTESKTFKTTKTVDAEKECAAHLEVVSTYAGFKLISRQATVKDDKVTKIVLKYSYFDNKNGAYKTKVISESNKGLYDSTSGKVYLWDTSDKVTVKHGETDVIVGSKQDKKGKEKDQKGYKAYEVPVAMHGQFVATDDNKAAGGFTGGVATAKDGTALDFAGLTAFGTGTTKDDVVKSVAGNVVMKYPNDNKVGCYGTWKLNIDSKSDKYDSLNAALLKKGCVELVEEVKQ